jgi:outer membrane receptor protein involved in Fe transport
VRVYAQDEWKITDQLTMNAGLRFDQMYQYVDANQLSPRISFTYKPSENTTWHAGYARYFTPPVLVEAAPANIALFRNTTGSPSQFLEDPVSPERSHYFDAGVSQKIPLGCQAPMEERDCGTLEVGADAYYKIANDLLSAFNYAKGYNEGVELKAKFTSGNFQAYGNIAAAQQRATDVVSNQYLFDNTTPLADLGGLTDFQYIQSHFIYTDHTQISKLIGMAKSRGGRDSVRGALESVSAYLECRDPALEAAARDAIADLRSALRHAEGPPLIAATL